MDEGDQARPGRGRRALRWGLGGLAVVLAAIVAIDVWVYGDFVPPRFPPMDPAPGVGTLSAQRCRVCHTAIYDEWADSGHARAFVDPLYQAELEHQPAPFVCHRCHSPLVEQRESLVSGLWLAWPTIVPIRSDNERFDAALREEGVTCVACHQVDGHMVGPIADPAEPPHPTRVGDLRSEILCARCHHFGFDRIGKLRRPIIDTIPEWAEYRAAGGDQRCADCHLPFGEPAPVVENGPVRPHTDHSLHGPWDAAFVATGVQVEAPVLTAEADGASASLTIVNGTGHRLPTAEPQRAVVVRLRARDGAGSTIAEDEVRFERRVDVEKLRELGEDTTLAPREHREVRLSVKAPLPSGTRVTLRVEFVRWDPTSEVAIAAGLTADALVDVVFEQESVRP